MMNFRFEFAGKKYKLTEIEPSDFIKLPDKMIRVNWISFSPPVFNGIEECGDVFISKFSVAEEDKKHDWE